MSTKDVSQPIRPERSRIDLVLTQYVIALSVVMMLFSSFFLLFHPLHT